MHDSIATWFSALNIQGPVMLWVDDIHWADSGSLKLIAHLARRLDQRPAMIVATYREVELDEARPFGQLLSSLRRDRRTSRIKLSRLDREETGQLLATLFDETITPEFLDGIYQETEGNPFFIEEVCKSLVEGGALYYEDGRWQRPPMTELEIPQGIKVTIQARLAKLSKQEQKVLSVAAISGRDFEYQMLAAAVTVDDEALIDGLERAEQAQLIEEVRQSGLPRGSRFSFTHALIHATLLSTMSGLRRQRLQRQVALALEEHFPARTRELAPRLGHFFAEAGEGDKAVPYLIQAGDDARLLYAYDEAIDSYEQALIFLREGDDHGATSRTLMKLGLTFHNTFSFEESRLAYEEAFAERSRANRVAAATVGLPDAPHALRGPMFFPPATLDPALAGDNVSIFHINLLFSGLVELLEGDGLAPDVALSWDVLEQGQRYIFHLRDDVRWSDGAAVTAGDFEYGLKRTLNPDNKDGLAENLYDIQGARAYHSGEVGEEESVGVRAIDDHALELTLERPSAHLLHILATSVCLPHPRHLIERLGAKWATPENIVTNGAFKIKLWRPEERVILERYADYHGRRKGNLKEFELVQMGLDEVLPAYAADELDHAPVYLEVIEDGARALQMHPDDYFTRPVGSTMYMVFDSRHPPLDDAMMRQAMVLAMDRDTLVSQLSQGTDLPALGGFVPPGIPGHVPRLAPPYNPLLARQKAAEAGYYDGTSMPELDLMVSPPHNRGGLFNAFAEQWLEHLGLKVRVIQADFYTVTDRLYNDPLPLMVMGWSADYPDPDNFLRASGILRYGGWRNAEYEALVDGARATLDQGQRLAMYRQAERLLVTEAPLVPISYGLLHMFVKPWIVSRPVNFNDFIVKDLVMEAH
jgi:oligopeptide transport system substrate-binding protein